MQKTHAENVHVSIRSRLVQAEQVIPVYFSGNHNYCHSKRKKSSQTKITELKEFGEDTFAIPIREVHFEKAIHELWRKGLYVGLQILENRQNGG